MADLKGNEIPDNLTLNVELDIAMPQDMVGQAQIVTGLKGTVPMRMLYEKILKLGQWDAAQEELWDEQYTDAMYGLAMQQLMQQAQQPPPQQMPAQQEAPPQMLPREMGMNGGQGPVDMEQGGGYESDIP